MKTYIEDLFISSYLIVTHPQDLRYSVSST